MEIEQQKKTGEGLMQMEKMVQENKFLKRVKSFMGTYFCLVAIIVLCLILTIASPYFFNYDNFKNILIQSAAVSIVCIGQFMCITKGGLDLSLGQVLCFSSCLMAVLMKNLGWNPYVSIILGLISGMLMGGFSGFMISYVGLPSFIATLATQNICRGLAKVITGASPIAKLPDQIDIFGKSYIGIFPSSVIIAVILYIVFIILMKKSKFGRCLYAIGGNKEASYFAGINVKLYTMLAHLVAGTLAAFAGLVLMARLGSVALTNGNMYEFDGTTGCCIGGVALAGGKGNLLQALLGIIFLNVFFNGMTMLNVDAFWQDVLKGIVLAAAVTFDTLRQRKRI